MLDCEEIEEKEKNKSKEEACLFVCCHRQSAHTEQQRALKNLPSFTLSKDLSVVQKGNVLIVSILLYVIVEKLQSVVKLSIHVFREHAVSPLSTVLYIKQYNTPFVTARELNNCRWPY
ncbi:hypothetical protein T4D_3205 [Trichinella pseudospiralis]|uniref:Uncharacterized protein n=1 Tax=Trichinella pseudospiralis TaxID=6337 RepID=A0A0V1FB07_TRIPS|nr:hypothetical protein T4D_3205 [Trichinella pseudospiralis]